MKTVLAFFVAALAPAILMTLWYLYGQFDTFPSEDPHIWGRTRNFMILCVVISLAHVLLLGVPAYAFLRWCKAVRWWSTIASGFVVAMAPIAVWSWPLQYADSRTSASFDGVQTMIDGAPTAAGWSQYAQGVLFFGACGACSGLAFWLTAWATGHNWSSHRTDLGGR